jgi:antirestriction protein ArdC
MTYSKSKTRKIRKNYDPEAAKAARDDKLAALHAKLAADVDELTKTENWQRMLELAGRFHSYSWRNLMLIWSQLPSFTRCASYKTWQSMGRQVRTGEKGLQILAPVFRPKTEDDPEDQDEQMRLIGWRLAYTFDVSQTEGEPLPEPVTRLQGEGPEGLFEGLVAHAEQLGFTLKYGADLNIPAGTNGYMDPVNKIIWIRPENDHAQQCKTLAHELAHVLLGHGTEEFSDSRSRGEIEAESVAYMVCQTAGLDTSGYSLGYVGHWAPEGKHAEEIAKTATRVVNTARKILDRLEAHVELVAA